MCYPEKRVVIGTPDSKTISSVMGCEEEAAAFARGETFFFRQTRLQLSRSILDVRLLP